MASAEVQGPTAEQQLEMILKTPEPSSLLYLSVWIKYPATTSVQPFYFQRFLRCAGKIHMDGGEIQTREGSIFFFFACKW